MPDGPGCSSIYSMIPPKKNAKFAKNATFPEDVLLWPAASLCQNSEVHFLLRLERREQAVSQ